MHISCTWFVQSSELLSLLRVHLIGHATLMDHVQASLHSDYEAAGLLRPGSGVDEVLARASRQLPSPQLVSPRPARRITGAFPCC